MFRASCSAVTSLFRSLHQEIKFDKNVALETVRAIEDVTYRNFFEIFLCGNFCNSLRFTEQFEIFIFTHAYTHTDTHTHTM